MSKHGFPLRHVMPVILFACLQLACLSARAQIDAAKPPYRVLPNVTRDQSAAVQAALSKAASKGGDRVILPAGTIYVKELSISNRVTLSGQGVGATVLKLPDDANTFLIASHTFVRNKPHVNLNGGLRDLTLDGNKKHNKTGSLLVIRTWRMLVRDCAFKNAPMHGILWSWRARDGHTGKGSFAEVRVINCSFDHNDGAGIYAKNDKGSNIADGMIYENNFNSNGGKGFYQIDLERAAGFQIVGNQMYGGGLGDLRALGAGAMIVRGNNFDGSANRPVDGRVRQVVLRTGGWGSCVISGNLFHNHAAEAGPWTMLHIITHQKDTIAVSGNVFRSEHIDTTPYTVVGRGKEDVVFSGNAIEKNRAKSKSQDRATPHRPQKTQGRETPPASLSDG